MGMKSVRFTLPWLPREILPNAKRRAHWGVYNGTVRQYRDLCRWLAREAMGRAIFDGRPEMAVEFFPPHDRIDDDAMIGGFKHARDGIADALCCDDRAWRPAYFYRDADAEHPRVVVTLCGPEVVQ